MKAATATTFKHTLNFSNSDEMGYASTHLDCFLSTIISIEEDEFDGDAPYEVRFTTAKSIPQTTIKKMVVHFAPSQHTFNGQA